MDLPSGIVENMIGLLRSLTLSESDFTLVSASILNDIKESGDEFTEEEADALLSSCLTIVSHILRNVEKAGHFTHFNNCSLAAKAQFCMAYMSSLYFKEWRKKMVKSGKCPSNV